MSTFRSRILLAAAIVTVETPVAGLELFSETTKDWVVLAVRGVSNGRGRITLAIYRGGRLTTGSSGALDGRAGSADLRLRLVTSPEGYRALLYQQTSGSVFDGRVDALAVWRSDLA